MTTERLVIVDGIRTPFSKMGTTLAPVSADELGRIIFSALITKTGIDPGMVDETIIGCVGQPADAANIARVVALRAGVPKHVPAITVHRNCASGCEAVTQAFEKIVAGRGSMFLVGGTESMSQYALLFKYSSALKFGQLNKAKTLWQQIVAVSKFRPSDFSPRIGLLLGLTDPVCNLNMGQTAELIVQENGITRSMQDEFAIESHRKAVAAKDRLAEEIHPVYIPPDYKKVMTADNGPRTDQSKEVLAKLRPVFEKPSGTVTAGNSSQVTDGAVALLVMSEKKAEELGFEPLGVLSGYAYAGCDPARMGLGPIHAIAKAEQTTGLSLKDADIIEINEAFSGQVLAVQKLAKSDDYAKTFLGRSKAIGEIPSDILNVNGGSVAIGHPVGATGSRMILTSLKELKRRRAKRALISLCVGGGQGAAVWVETL